MSTKASMERDQEKPAKERLRELIYEGLNSGTGREAERLTLSARDSVRVLDALESPPVPTAKLLRAARRLPKHA